MKFVRHGNEILSTNRSRRAQEEGRRGLQVLMQRPIEEFAELCPKSTTTRTAEKCGPIAAGRAARTGAAEPGGGGLVDGDKTTVRGSVDGREGMRTTIRGSVDAPAMPMRDPEPIARQDERSPPVSAVDIINGDRVEEDRHCCGSRKSAPDRHRSRRGAAGYGVLPGIPAQVPRRMPSEEGPQHKSWGSEQRYEDPSTLPRWRCEIPTQWYVKARDRLGP